MCVHRRTMDGEISESGGLKGGASCSHRSKKSYFKTKELRKKMKSGKRCCQDCERQSEKSQPTAEAESELLMCVSCGQMACAEHAKKHCEASRTGDPHPFLYSINKNILRCHPCDVDLEPLEDPADPVKLFFNECKSFAKTKAAEAEAKKEAKEEKVKVIDAPEEPSVSNDAATKPLVKEDLDDNRPTRRTGSLKTSASTPNGFASGETMIPAKGLANLGNTCFFNSVMQCIMHTHHLQYYFEKFGRVKTLQFKEEKTVVVNEEKIELKPADMPVKEDDCPLNDVLRRFIGEFRCNTSPAPGSVFSQISRMAPRFKGWQQQDAHELLRYLLDGLRSEEQERYKSAIAAHHGVSKSTNQKKIDPAIVKAAKGYLNDAGRPLLDAVFGGTLLQTIRCSDCGHISERMEQFLDLSIPLSANPMSARTAGGHSGNRPQQLSAHQKKKAEKEAKKANRRQNRQTVAKKDNGPSTSNGDVNASTEELESVVLSESESDEMEEEETAEDCRNGAGVDRLDMTKVLAPAPAEYQHERSVGACLLEFTAEELLAGSNAYECEGCCVPVNKKKEAKGPQKKRVEAVKRYLIYEPPAVLTLQLKRFQQVAGYAGRLSTRKLGGHVDFPLLFDIAPFCCKNVERVAVGQKKIFYSLYGVVVHSGDLSGGHYIAYVKSRHRVPHALQYLEAARASCVDAMFHAPAVDLMKVADVEPESPDGQWYYCSDSRVNAETESKALAAEAYILFYERVV